MAGKYGGELIKISLRDLLKKGRGDDVRVVVNHEPDSKYGILDVQFNEFDLQMAEWLAIDSIASDFGPMLVAVEDEESGSPMVLTRKIEYAGETHYLAVIFNASFACNPEETSDGSYCLRLSAQLDPDGKFSERICYTPGKNLNWTKEQIEFLRSKLEA